MDASTLALTMVARISGSLLPMSQSLAISRSSRCFTKILSTGMCVASSVGTVVAHTCPLGSLALTSISRGKVPLYRPLTTTGEPQKRSGMGNG